MSFTELCNCAVLAGGYELMGYSERLMTLRGLANGRFQRLPFTTLPGFLVPAAHENDDGEEERERKAGEDDDDDAHGVRRGLRAGTYGNCSRVRRLRIFHCH